MILIATAFTGCQAFNGKGNLFNGQNNGNGLFGLQRPDYRRIDPDEALDPLGERNPDRVVLQDLAPGQLSTTWDIVTHRGESPEQAQQLLDDAQQLYSSAVETKNANPEGDGHIAMFEEAANKYRLAASRWPDSSVEEDSLYYEGEAYFFANRYVQSNRTFEKLISLYSGTRYLDRAEARRFAIARYWLELAKQSNTPSFNNPQRPATNVAGEARRILHRIRLDDPTGRLADDATIALANAYFEDGRYQEAGDTFEDLRRNYPGSEHQYYAHIFELKSRLKSYQGPDYDDYPLRQADELMRAIVSQFPNEAGEHREFLATEATRIRQQLAQRDVTMASYFAGRGENRAAQIYYHDLRENFSDVQAVGEVEARIAALDEMPPTPPQRAQWLVDLFPDNVEEKPLIADGNESLIR